jgi:hypothetical protein
MILYHFVAIHLLEAVKREGLTLGVLPLRDGKRVFIAKNCQWLTRNPDFGAQHWATFRRTLPYDRTAYRINVVIPKAHRIYLKPWPELCLPDNYLNETLGWQDWYVFVGRIPAGWFREIVKKP